MSLLETLTNVVSSQVAQQAAQKTGLSNDAAAKLAPMAMAVLMNGLKNNAASNDGAQALSSALDNHDGGLLSQLTRLGDDDVMADGDKILGHILGGKRGQAEQQLAQAAGGVDSSQVASILKMAAPAVLGALGQAKREQGLDANALSGLLKTEGARAQAAAPSELNGFMKMLDADGDGNLNNEAMGLGKRLLGGLFGRK
ncbi:MAG: DUF937 domain-containing protein [Pseudomonadota bacterium]